MKFSVCLSTGFEGVMAPIPFAGPEDFIAQGQLCERLGYDSVWGNDHVTTQDYVRKLYPGKPPNFYEPMMVLAAIGAVTTKLKLGTALTVLPSMATSRSTASSCRRSVRSITSTRSAVQ